MKKKKKKYSFQVLMFTTDNLIVPLQTRSTGCANVVLKNMKNHFGATSGAEMTL